MTVPRKRALQGLCRIAVEELEKSVEIKAFGRLAKSFRYRVREDDRRATVYSIYYWAAFVDQGRAAIKGKLMRFFRDPDDDPRVSEDYPRKVSDRKKLRDFLTGAEMYALRKAGKLIVTKQVAAARARGFIDEALVKVGQRAPKYMQKFLRDEVKTILDETRDGQRVRRVSIRLV